MTERRVAIITGGGTGIGKGIARVLAARGMSLVLAQRRVELAEAAASELGSSTVIAVGVDVRQPSSVDQMVQTAEQSFGQIDILVHAASVTGHAALQPALLTESTHVDHVVDTNVKGTFYCARAIARHMVRRDARGSIIFISSVAAYAAQELASLYCASKAAQVSLARSLALELAPHGIRVNCVAPGDIRTEASAGISSRVEQTGGTGLYIRRTPLGRQGTPDEIGEAVAFLASDSAAFVTGATLTVDGGFLCY